MESQGYNSNQSGLVVTASFEVTDRTVIAVLNRCEKNNVVGHIEANNLVIFIRSEGVSVG